MIEQDGYESDSSEYATDEDDEVPALTLHGLGADSSSDESSVEGNILPYLTQGLVDTGTTTLTLDNYVDDILAQWQPRNAMLPLSELLPNNNSEEDEEDLCPSPLPGAYLVEGDPGYEESPSGVPQRPGDLSQ